MSQAPGSFRPGELDGADQRPSDADVAGAYSMARELEASLPGDLTAPSADFGDRVMAAIALEPAPRPAGFLAVLRARPGLAGLIASVREAWVVVGGGAGRPMQARGLALAYVFAVLVIGTSLTGVAAYSAAGALGLLDGDASPSPTVQETVAPSTEPSPSPTPTPTTTPSPTPSESAEPTESTEPDSSIEPEESDDHGGATPTATADESDDDESSPSPSQEEDGDSSSEPGDTPRPSDTPKPSQTPN